MAYHRTYTIDAATRQRIRGVALLLPMVALVGTAGQLLGPIHRSLSAAGMIVVGGASVLFVFSLWLGTNRRVIIDADAIHVTGWTTQMRTLTRDQIRGRRMGRGGRYRQTAYYIIVPIDQTKGELRLPLYLHTDRQFHDWMAGIPKIDE